MNRLILSVCALFAYILAITSVKALEVERLSQGGLRITNDNIQLDLIEGDFPEFAVSRYVESTLDTKYTLRFDAYWQSVAVGDVDALSGSQVNFQSLDYSFSDWEIVDEHLRLTVSTQGNDGEKFFFLIDVPALSRDFKFTLQVENFRTEFWMKEAKALVIAARITEQEGENGKEKNVQFISSSNADGMVSFRFGRRGYLELDGSASAYVNGELQDKSMDRETRVSFQGSEQTFYVTIQRFDDLNAALRYDFDFEYRSRDNMGYIEEIVDEQNSGAASTGLSIAAICASVVVLVNCM